MASREELEDMGLAFFIANPIAIVIAVVVAIVFLGITVHTLSTMFFDVSQGALFFLLVSVAVAFLVDIKDKLVFVAAGLAGFWTLFMIFLQSQSALCQAPLIGGILCGLQNIVLVVPNIFLIFIPVFIVFMVELFILTLIKNGLRG